MPPKLHNNETPSIPDELVTEILSYLPLESLIRFMLVCKTWNSLIYDNLSYLRRRANPRLLSVSNVAPFNVSSLPVKSLLKTPHSEDESHLICTLENRYDVIGSCNGLICLLGTHLYRIGIKWVLFLNPTTRSMSHKTPEVEIDCVGHYGFGYDHVTDTYKVVLLPQKLKIKVFSMGETNWKVTRFSVPYTIINGRVGVHINGTLNWLVSRNNQKSAIMIFSFDLNKEEHVTFSLPDIDRHAVSRILGVLDGFLCVSYVSCSSGYNLSIWQMKEFGIDDSWTQLLNIRYEDLQSHPGMTNYQCVMMYYQGLRSDFPLCLFDNGDFVMLKERLLCNHRDNRVELLQIPKNINGFNAVSYFESFISAC